MVSASVQVCGFVPLRGAANFTGRSVQLADDITLHLATDDTDAVTGLTQALTHPAHQVWTGITIGDADPVEHLDLWLATTTRHFARLSTGPQVRRSGQITPALRWTGATLHDGTGTLTYLTLRPTGHHTDELGITTHGPASTTFAAHTTEILHHWSKKQPTQPTITAHPSRTPDAHIPDGIRITKPNTTLTITW